MECKILFLQTLKFGLFQIELLFTMFKKIKIIETFFYRLPQKKFHFFKIVTNFSNNISFGHYHQIIFLNTGCLRIWR